MGITRGWRCWGTPPGRTRRPWSRWGGGDAFRGPCGAGGAGVPATLIGIAGYYDPRSFVPLPETLREGQVENTRLFLGGGPEEAPAAWAAGDPSTYLGEGPGLRTLLIHGQGDEIVGVEHSQEFAARLDGANYSVQLTLIPDAGHAEVAEPGPVGEEQAVAIVTFLREG